MTEQYIGWMQVALMEAKRCRNDIPVGSAVFDSHGNLMSKARNVRETSNDLLGHAEVGALSRIWGREPNASLVDCTLVTTLEPCLMCAGAIRETGVTRLIFGASNTQRGAAGSLYDVLRDSRLGRPVEVVPGILATECAELIDNFFARIRSTQK